MERLLASRTSGASQQLCSSNSRRVHRSRSHKLALRRNRRRQLAAQASASDLFEDGLGEDSLGSSDFSEDLTVPTTCMAQLSGGGATMQKSKLNLQQEVRISQPKTDDAGGGGDIGNRIFNGGGGDGDDSDDDEYQDDFGDDEEGDAGKVGLFDIREALPELFDKATMECILSEWYKTVVSLPAGLRLAVEMSVISSAQLVRFLSMDYRPQLTRSLTRALPTEPARHFVGRLMGDPAFIYKVGLEQFLTITGSVLCELKLRGKERFQKEWKQVVANTTALCMGNAMMIWMTAPSRAFGSTSKYAWQQSLAKLPNHVFEKSGPLRRYTMVDRSQAFLLKSGQLGLIGLTTGALGVAFNKLVGGGAEGTSSSSSSSSDTAALWRGPVMGMGLHMALSSHFRYQGIAGVDRWLGQRCSHLGMVLGGTTAVRVVNSAMNEVSRTLIQGQNLFSFEKKDGKKKNRRNRSQKQQNRSGAYASTASTATALKARVMR